MNIPENWSELYWTVDDVTLVCPSLRLELFVQRAEGAEVLDFYRHAREALGDALTHVSTGGNWKKITAKTDPMVTTWCEHPVPWPKKIYSCLMQGAAEGVTPANLLIDFAMRPYEAPTARMLEQWRNPDFYPGLRHSCLSVALPVDHPLAEPERFTAWVMELQALKACHHVWGTAGYSIDRAWNISSRDLAHKAGGRVAALLARHPGLDLQRMWTSVRAYATFDREYLEFLQKAESKPYLKRANWLNFLTEGQVTFLGGVDKLCEMFAPWPTIRLQELAHGLMIQAGEAPVLGDMSTGNIPSEYATVAKAVARIRVPEIKPLSMGSDWFYDEGAEQWLNILERE